MTAFACNFGVKTRSGHGGFPVGVGRTIVSGGSFTDFTIDDQGCLVPAGTYGVVRPYALSLYNLTLDNGDTVAVTMVPNAAHVRGKPTGATNDTDNISQLQTLFNTAAGVSGALSLGDTVWGRTSTFNAALADKRIRPTSSLYAAGTGPRVIVRSEFVDTTLNAVDGEPNRQHGFVIGRLSVDGSQAGAGVDCPIEFRDIQFFGKTDTRNNALQMLGKFSSAQGYRVYNCGFYGDPAGADRPSGLALGTNCVADHNTFHFLFDGVVSGGDNITFTNNVISLALNDAMKGSHTNLTLEDNFIYDKKYPLGAAAHGDFFQDLGQTVAPAARIFASCQRNIFVRGLGEPGYVDGQGLFCDDSKVDIPGSIVQNNIIFNTMQNGIAATKHVDHIERRNTTVNDHTIGPVISDAGQSGNVYNSTTGYFNATHGLCEQNIANAYQDLMTNPDTPNGKPPVPNTIAPATFQNNVQVAKTLTDYAGIFRAPAYGSDVRSRRAAMLALTPIKNGPAKLPDGRYAGALFPSETTEPGAWNDGSVYSAVPVTPVDASAPGAAKTISLAAAAGTPHINAAVTGKALGLVFSKTAGTVSGGPNAPGRALTLRLLLNAGGASAGGVVDASAPGTTALLAFLVEGGVANAASPLDGPTGAGSRPYSAKAVPMTFDPATFVLEDLIL